MPSVLSIKLFVSYDIKFTIRVTPWNQLMTMANSYFELSNTDNFLLRPRCILVKITSNNMDIICKGFKVIKAIFGA